MRMKLSLTLKDLNVSQFQNLVLYCLICLLLENGIIIVTTLLFTYYNEKSE